MYATKMVKSANFQMYIIINLNRPYHVEKDKHTRHDQKVLGPIYVVGISEAMKVS